MKEEEKKTEQRKNWLFFSLFPFLQKTPNKWGEGGCFFFFTVLDIDQNMEWSWSVLGRDPRKGQDQKPGKEARLEAKDKTRPTGYFKKGG